MVYVNIQRKFYISFFIAKIRPFPFFLYPNPYFQYRVVMISCALKVTNFPTVSTFICSLISFKTLHVARLKLWKIFQNIYEELLSVNQRRNGIEITHNVTHLYKIGLCFANDGKTFKESFLVYPLGILVCPKSPEKPGQRRICE